MEIYKKAKRKAGKTKSPYEVHPFKTISITDLNWFVKITKQLEQENEKLKGVYQVTNEDWKRLHLVVSEITNAYQDDKLKNEDFIFAVGEILKKYRDS